jgi:hypothetical protein
MQMKIEIKIKIKIKIKIMSQDRMAPRPNVLPRRQARRGKAT